MREIKFRGWYKNQMIPFLNLSGVNDYYNDDCISLICQYPEEVVVMQYTGVRDKNGKEIFDGDIVKWKQEIEEKFFIEWIAKSGGWNFLPVDAQNMEVIGNIWENKELLTP